jgi:hypothetical protein
MKDYNSTSEDDKNSVNEPAVAYKVGEKQKSFFPLNDLDNMDNDIPLDENGNLIGYTLDEVFDEVDRNLSEAYGIDFMKLTRMVRSGEATMDEMTDERLRSPEFKYVKISFTLSA